MNGEHLKVVPSSLAGVLVGLLLAFQVGAQGQTGGARPGGATGAAVNTGGMGNTASGIDGGWPRGPAVQAPLRLPSDKTLGAKDKDARANKAANASSAASASAQRNSAAEARCVEAKAAIAAAGNGGTAAKGQGRAAGAEGRAKSTAAVCSGIGKVPADAGRSTEAPGYTGSIGLEQATHRTNEQAAGGLNKAQSKPPTGAASDSRKYPEPSPPQ
jgi:hypothetical protein